MLEVPDDPAHVAAFRGALLTLASAYNWADDPAHTAKDVALVWRDLIDSHQDWGCEVGRDTQIRVDDICTLAWTYDNWVTFDTYDPSSCIMALIDSIVPGMIATGIQDALNDGTIPKPGGQPGPSSPPPPGECKTYHVALPGNGSWALPSPLGFGDLVTVSNVTGGWSDGSLAWYCPDGARFLLGACAEDLKTHEDGDVLNPGAYHMALVMRVGETWFPAPLTGFLNEGGTSDIPAIFQANDGTLSDNTGTIEFDVMVCSNAGPWTHCYSADTDQWQGVVGWDLDGAATAIPYLDNNVWYSTPASGNSYCNVYGNMASEAHITKLRVIGTAASVGSGYNVNYGAEGYARDGQAGSVSPFDVEIEVDFMTDTWKLGVTVFGAITNVLITEIQVSGDGACPFASRDNCS